MQEKTQKTFHHFLTKNGQPISGQDTDTANIEIECYKWTTKFQRFVKLKELQADTQANAFAAHLILPNHTQSSPTTRAVDDCHFNGNF